jgi:hypothetical protein
MTPRLRLHPIVRRGCSVQALGLLLMALALATWPGKP